MRKIPRPLLRSAPLASLWCIALLLLGAAILSGCDDRRIPVGGEVTFNGKPVDDGAITFEPTDGHGPTTGGKIENGKYMLTGNAATLAGKKTVRITAMRKTGRKIADSFVPEKKIDELLQYIPADCNTKSTLSCDVRSAATSCDFHLKSQ